MRILMVTDYYWPYVGGVEQHVRSLSHALSDRGHSVAVATLRATPSRGRSHLDGPVRVHEVTDLLGLCRGVRRGEPGSVDSLRFRRSWAPPLIDPVAASGLGRIVAAERPDVVHGHDWLARSIWPWCLGRRPLVLSLHYYTRSCVKKNLMRAGRPCRGPSPMRCAACASEHYGPIAGPVSAAANFVGAWIDDRVARRVIAVSRAAASGNGLAPDGSRVAVIPNLLAPTAPTTPVEDAEVAAEVTALGLPEGPYALFVGDRRFEKGADLLLDAYARVRDALPLVMLGKSTERRVGDLPPGVQAVGPVSNAAVLKVWGRAAFGIVPSCWSEPFGIVVIEAMAAGVPVVAARTGGIPEIVTDGVDGLLVPLNDAPALTAALQRLTDSPKLATRLGTGARLRAAAYEASVVAAQVEAVYYDVVDRSR